MRVVSDSGGVRAVAVLATVPGEAGPPLVELYHLAVQAPGGGTHAGVVSEGELVPRVEEGGPHPLPPEAVAVAPGLRGPGESPLGGRAWQTEAGLQGEVRGQSADWRERDLSY